MTLLHYVPNYLLSLMTSLQIKEKDIRTNKSHYSFVKSFCNLFTFDLIILNTLSTLFASGGIMSNIKI